MKNNESMRALITIGAFIFNAKDLEILASEMRKLESNPLKSGYYKLEGNHNVRLTNLEDSLVYAEQDQLILNYVHRKLFEGKPAKYKLTYDAYDKELVEYFNDQQDALNYISLIYYTGIIGKSGKMQLVKVEENEKEEV